MAEDKNQEEKDTGKTLMDHTIKELKEMAKSEGVSDVDVYNTKSQLISMISTVRAMKAAMVSSMQASVQQVDISKPNISPKDDKKWRMNHTEKAKRTKEILDKQPKQSILIPLELGEPKGTYHEYILNGYRLNIMKGRMVQVPQTVAEDISRSFDLLAEAGANLDMNRVDPKTGKPFREALSDEGHLVY